MWFGSFFQKSHESGEFRRLYHRDRFREAMDRERARPIAGSGPWALVLGRGERAARAKKRSGKWPAFSAGGCV